MTSLQAVAILTLLAFVGAAWVALIGVLWDAALILFHNWRVARSRATVHADSALGFSLAPSVKADARTRGTTPRDLKSVIQVFPTDTRTPDGLRVPLDETCTCAAEPKPHAAHNGGIGFVPRQVIPSEAQERMDLLHWPEPLDDSPWHKSRSRRVH